MPATTVGCFYCYACLPPWFDSFTQFTTTYLRSQFPRYCWQLASTSCHYLVLDGTPTHAFTFFALTTLLPFCLPAGPCLYLLPTPPPPFSTHTEKEEKNYPIPAFGEKAAIPHHLPDLPLRFTLLVPRDHHMTTFGRQRRPGSSAVVTLRLYFTLRCYYITTILLLVLHTPFPALPLPLRLCRFFMIRAFCGAVFWVRFALLLRFAAPPHAAHLRWFARSLRRHSHRGSWLVGSLPPAFAIPCTPRYRFRFFSFSPPFPLPTTSPSRRFTAATHSSFCITPVTTVTYMPLFRSCASWFFVPFTRYASVLLSFRITLLPLSTCSSHLRSTTTAVPSSTTIFHLQPWIYYHIHLFVLYYLIILSRFSFITDLSPFRSLLPPCLLYCLFYHTYAGDEEQHSAVLYAFAVRIIPRLPRTSFLRSSLMLPAVSSLVHAYVLRCLRACRSSATAPTPRVHAAPRCHRAVPFVPAPFRPSNALAAFASSSAKRRRDAAHICRYLPRSHYHAAHRWLVVATTSRRYFLPFPSRHACHLLLCRFVLPALCYGSRSSRTRRLLLPFGLPTFCQFYHSVRCCFTFRSFTYPSYQFGR